MTTPNHSKEYRRRRLLNWFPLGLTYATFYMGRYNFNVVKGTMGSMFQLDKAEMGIIATAGFWTYALSVMFNGPLADRLGGRKAIIFGAIGSALLNLIIGMCFLSGWTSKIVVGMSLLYSVNMYFQSFGALSVVKVNAPWFHVRERGIFGGIFGIMISLGYMFAISFGGWILANMSWFMVFFVPSAAILTMGVIDYFLVRDLPSQAGHVDFDTGDASSGDSKPVDLAYIAKKVFSNPVILTIAAAEFCTGFVRQGLLLYFVEFLKEVHHVDLGSAMFWWAGTGITIGGIIGGLLCGWMSDKLFDSRRAPVAAIFYALQVVALLMLGFTQNQMAACTLIGVACIWIFGVHGMLSGTASMDFGGKKAAASAAGMLDGVQYLASGLTGFGLGWILKTYGWDGVPDAGHQAVDAHIWVYSIIPFSIIGGLIISTLWNAKPGKNAH
jgi:OPA family glycerol-3-phosphate transporter-like MFS transporter